MKKISSSKRSTSANKRAPVTKARRNKTTKKVIRAGFFSRNRVLVGIAFVLAIGAISYTMIPNAFAKKPTKLPTVVQSYGTTPTETVTIYPQSTANSHIVVMVHGGGWHSGVNANMEVIAAKQLQNAGFTVFDANYDDDSNAPAFPNEINDIANATSYAITNAATYGGNPNKVTLLGGSSGGQLAAMAALQLNAAKKGTVSSVVTLSGPSDFPTLIAGWASTGGPIGDLHINNEMTALGCASPSTCPVATENLWSPDKQVNSNNCPANWLILNGNNELMPVVQADDMTSALKAVGCNVTETIFKDTKHSFDYFKPNQEGPTIENFISAN
jgi:acetyl esterase/lipase